MARASRAVGPHKVGAYVYIYRYGNYLQMHIVVIYKRFLVFHKNVFLTFFLFFQRLFILKKR